MRSKYLIVGITIFSLSLILLINNITIPISSYRKSNIKNDDSENNIDTDLKTAEIPYYLKNFDDNGPENYLNVFYDSSSSFQELQIEYVYSGGDDIVVTGFNILHSDNGAGSNFLNVTVFPDSGAVTYDFQVPHRSTPTWDLLQVANTNFVLDDDPIVRFESNETFSSCLRIGADTPSQGNSAYNNEGSGGWTYSSSYEYMVELMIEYIIELSSGSSDSGSITNEDFLDVYKVYLWGSFEYNFTMTRTAGTGDLNIRLVKYESITGASLNSTSGNNAKEEMLYTPTSTGWYLLLIEPNNPTVDIANYTIHFDRTSDEDEYEENDDYSNSASISPGFYPNLYCGDDDWYVVNVPANNKICVELDLNWFFDGGLALDLFETGPNRVRDSFISGPNHSEINYTTTSGGNYYIRVNKTGSYPNNYNLTVTLYPIETDDSYEENDDFANAKKLSEGIYKNLKCWDDDWFYINGTSGDSLNITIKFTHANGDLDLCVYDPSLTLIGNSSSTTDNEQVLYNMTSNGYYYIYIYKKSSGDNNNYDLIIQIKPPGISDDSYEENDNFIDAKQLTAGTYNNLKCFDDDWYYISVSENNNLNITIKYSYINGDLDLELYDSSQTLLDSSTSTTDDESISYDITSGNGGNYYFRVYKKNPSDNNSYILIISINSIQPSDDSFEENDNIFEAAPINAGTYTDLNCSDDDYYSIDLNAGDTIIVQIIFINFMGNLDLYFCKLDFITEIILNYSTSTTDNEEISYKISTTGTYFIKVNKSSILEPSNLYNMIITIEKASTSSDNQENNGDKGEDDSSSGNSDFANDLIGFLSNPIGLIIIFGIVGAIVIPVVVIRKVKANEEYYAIKKAYKEKRKLESKLESSKIKDSKKQRKIDHMEVSESITQPKKPKEIEKDKSKTDDLFDISDITKDEDDDDIDWEWDDFFD
ncbi:MAG: PPC domain-containing protein [Promethearchaeota archaeon]